MLYTRLDYVELEYADRMEIESSLARRYISSLLNAHQIPDSCHRLLWLPQGGLQKFSEGSEDLRMTLIEKHVLLSNNA